MSDMNQNSGGQNDEPIIIKKVKKGGGGHHGGAWKVAYADFVTAMMALFIVLWILSASEEVKEKVAGYFQDPLGYKTGGGVSVIDLGKGKGKGKNDNPPPSEMTEEQKRELEMNRLTKMGRDLKQQMSKNGQFQALMNQVEVQIVDEGLRIEIMDSNNDAFFEIGTAKLKAGANKLISLIGKELGELNNKIAIEGHTDSRPFPGGKTGYSNYELSCDRANAARRALLGGGLNEKQIDNIRGYADNRLRNPNNPLDVLNRRISIIVKYTENL